MVGSVAVRTTAAPDTPSHHAAARRAGHFFAWIGRILILRKDTCP
jgi:hypothetical protein